MALASRPACFHWAPMPMVYRQCAQSATVKRSLNLIQWADSIRRMSVFGMRAAVIGLLLSAWMGRSADFTPEDFKQTQLEAEKGDSEAQVALGRMCYLGQGTPQNYGEALKWYRRAAGKGNAAAQNHLALMYLNGHGVPRNPSESAKWMQLAARQGLPKAQLNLGTFYLEGIGVGRNPPEALNWFRRAANQGDSEGQRMLGQLHLEGQLARADLV